MPYRSGREDLARSVSDDALHHMSNRSLPVTERKPRAFVVGGKLKAAIEAMVWQGLPRKQAAEAAEMTEHGLYKAFRKPPVKAYYLAELDVLRTSERARNFHRLCDIRDAGNNMPAVNAIKALEQIADDAGSGSTARQSLPGVVIQIVNNADSDRSTLVNVSQEPKEGER
jgi:hypothetical protein